MTPKTVHYRQHQDFASPSWLQRQSLTRRPVWPIVVGYGFGIALSLYTFYRIGRLLGIIG